MASRMLVSKYVKEDGNNRLIKRASNIATWFLDNYGKFQGSLISSKEIRTQIHGRLGTYTGQCWLPGFGGPTPGDLKAHGQAIKVLNLNSDLKNKEKHVDMSLINAKRCASFLLGKGKIAKSLYLKKTKAENMADNDLIDLALTLDQKRLDKWESNFINSLDRSFRNGLSSSQRQKLMKTINDRA